MKTIRRLAAVLAIVAATLGLTAATVAAPAMAGGNGSIVRLPQ